MNIEIAISHARDGKKTMEEWGLGKSFNYGNTALNFVGLPGTGKTLCAEAIAHELGKKLLVIQPAQLMDMWVGETEKKIVCAFKQAEKLDGVLFFDEADSIVSRRVAVSRSGDSHHNNGINVILQELEKFKGVVIFATNIAINLDPALERRVAMHILFEKPGLKEREQLFRKLTPKRMPLTSDVDFSALSVHEFVGGEIMNVVINAIRIAIYEGAKKVKMEYFERGVEIVLGNRKVMIAGATEFKKESFVS